MAKEKIEKILAVETSSKIFSVALAESLGSPQTTKILAEASFDVGPRHSSLLAPACRFLLDRTGTSKEDLTSLAVSTGPGSFTGLRVGISFLRAAAQALKIPLIGIPAFDILAGAARENLEPAGWTCVLIDSIGEDVNTGFFNAKGGLVRPYFVDSISRVLSQIRKHNPLSCLFAGYGARRYRALIEKELGKSAQFAPESFDVPRAKILARIALEKIKNEKLAARSWREVAPLYLRPPQAIERLKWKKMIP